MSALPFFDFVKGIFVKKKKPYVKRSDYWLDVKGNRERIKKLRGKSAVELQREINTLDANRPLSQAEIEYMAAQAQAKINTNFNDIPAGLKY